MRLRRRRGFRRSGRGRELFWVRYSGQLQMAVSGTAVNFVLLDPRNFEPSATAYGEDVSGRALTLHRVKFTYGLDFSSTTVGTADVIDFFFGIGVWPTTLVRSASCGTADDQRVDWLDLWKDEVQHDTAVPTHTIASLGTSAPRSQRDIKSKRSLTMRFETALMFSGVMFPHLGAFGTSPLGTCNFLVSMLLSKA